MGCELKLDIFYNNLNPIKEKLDIYTTRPDTIFGATFCAISPSHPMLNQISEKSSDLVKFVEKYESANLNEENIAKTEKEGVKLDYYIKHPLIEN